MIRYALQRLLMLIPVLLGITVLVFVLMEMLPGDPATAILGPYSTPERVSELEASLDLDQPMPVRYLTWLGNLLHGDFGRSYALDRPVADVLGERIGPTLLLAGAALTLGAALGLLLGMLAAVANGSWVDKLLTIVAVTGFSVPAFWLAMLLIIVFSVGPGWFPVSGMRSLYGENAGSLWDLLRHLALPAVSLGVISAGVIARITRGEMIEVLGRDFVQLARAKGLSEADVLYRHAFRAALGRVVPVIGLQAGFVLGGAIYIETVFQWPGIGRTLIEAIGMRDILLVQGGVVVVASAYVFINMLADLAQRIIDPRVDV